MGGLEGPPSPPTLGSTPAKAVALLDIPTGALRVFSSLLERGT